MSFLYDYIMRREVIAWPIVEVKFARLKEVITPLLRSL
jgi:hypothetical protein